MVKRSAEMMHEKPTQKPIPLSKTNILRKKAWTSDEDDKLMNLVTKHGAHKWSHIANLMKDRVGKQCRERWHNHLNPKIKKDAWLDREEWTLFISHQLMGNKWAEISKHIFGRTDNSIKNHWNSTMRKKLTTLRQRLLAAIELCNTQPAKFTKKFSLFERDTIKEIIATDAMNKNWDAMSENGDTVRVGKRNGADGSNRQRISLDLFDNVERIDELIDSIDKNLISIPEMAAILEFINQHEDIIMKHKEIMIPPNSTSKNREGFKHVSVSFNTPGKNSNIIKNENEGNKVVPPEFNLYSNENTPIKNEFAVPQPITKPPVVADFNIDNFDVSSAIFQPITKTPKETPFKKCILSVLKDHDYASPEADAERKGGAKPTTNLIRSPF